MPMPERLGKYRILKPLGAGAMGEVYLAQHERLRVLHAVKILPSDACGRPGFESRFEAEARIMARLRHPGIVPVHDLDRDETTGAYFIAMDFVSPDGESPQTLDDLFEQSGGRLAHDKTGEILLALCDAVAYAHGEGVLHRDIKPSNILIDAGGIVRLADFGLAEIVGQEYIEESLMENRTRGTGESVARSRAESLVGTYHFMPPEVQTGGEWSERGDVYSLGVVAYRSLVGEYPIGRWELPSEHFADIPVSWDAVVERALKTRPALRYQSAKAMGEAIASLGGADAPQQVSNSEQATHRHSAATMATSEKPNGRGEYVKPFYFREKEYRNLESLVEAFAENEASWSDALVAVGRGYVRKWLESNDDYGRAAEMEKHAEKSPEEQREILLHAYAPGKAEKVRSRMKTVVTPEKDRSLENRVVTPEKKVVVPEKRLAPLDRSVITLEKDGSELLLIPAGEFEMGDGKDDNCPKHPVFLDAYYIGKYCVTNAQYARFVSETGHRPPNNGFWNTPEKAEHPVTNLSWDDAMAYAKWAGCDLPTEAQWEKAARGPSGYIYPWGNEWSESKCRNQKNRGSETTAPVHTYTDGASGYGTIQQSGNIREWCSDWYSSDYYKSSEASRNPRGPSTGSGRVRRGGSWGTGDPSIFRGTYRSGDTPSCRCNFMGFRLVRTP